jgi:hypothetical protein
MAITTTTGRRGDIMKAPRGWQPAEPKVRFSERGKFLYTRLSLNVAPGVVMNFSSRVDLELIEKNLRDGVSDEISGIFGSIFKGIKKAVKTVGKATGLNKVVKFAGKVLNNPIVKAVVPGAAAASAGVKIASDVAKATGLAGGGKRRRPRRRRARPRRTRRQKAANFYLTRAAVRAQKAGLAKPSTAQAVKAGAKMYQLIVQPK